MFVRPKKQIQKSFRLDENVERDLGILANLTERSQNDLANVALEELLQDNKSYFLKIAVLEHFRKQIDLGLEKFEPFNMGDLEVQVSYVEGEKVLVRSIVEYVEDNVDIHEEKFNSDISDEFENYLKELSVYIDSTSKDVIEYLERRTDYRDYVKVRKK